MKKMMFIMMALLIAAPAMAAVTLTNTTPSGTTVTVGWSGNGATAATRARAFALTLVATGGTISSVTATKTGDNTTSSKGYGIFPGTFNVITDMNNPNWSTAGYTPVEPNDLHGGGKSKIGTSQVIVALGSLYKASDANLVPPTSGNLFTVVCSSATTALTITPETASRGGVVGEDANTMTIGNPSQTLSISFGAPAEAVKSTAPFYADWVAFGKPACWAYRKTCRGDIDGLTQGNKTSTWSVGTNDLNILVPVWQLPGTLSSTAICADIDHASQGNKTSTWRVGTNDLNLLVPNWQVPGIADCPQDNYNFWTN